MGKIPVLFKRNIKIFIMFFMDHCRAGIFALCLRQAPCRYIDRDQATCIILNNDYQVFLVMTWWLAK